MDVVACQHQFGQRQQAQDQQWAEHPGETAHADAPHRAVRVVGGRALQETLANEARQPPANGDAQDNNPGLPQNTRLAQVIEEVGKQFGQRHRR